MSTTTERILPLLRDPDATWNHAEVTNNGYREHSVRGERYRYTSGTMLQTPVGSMRGSYLMRAEDGHRFRAEIPMFTLALPGVLH